MSVAKMKDGKRWYVFVRYKDWTGETRQHKKEGFDRRSDAKEYEKQFLEQRTGSPDMTIASLYALYMEDCKTRLKPTTYANKDFLFQKHVLPYLGNLRASDVGPASIRKWQNTLLAVKREDTGEPYAQTYLKTVHNQASAMFNYGMKYYGLKSNPCRQAGAMGKKNADAMQFWTVDEFNRFLTAISNKSHCVVMFSLLFWTGMRSGEMLALTPSDFNFAANTVSITKNYARQDGQDLILEPKTPKSRRVIPIPSTLAVMVQNYLATLYDLNSGDRIFPGNTKYILQHEMKRGCAASGVKRIRIHDLRHSHASLLIEMGYSPLLIAERLGHENIETTLQTYSHLYPNKQGQLVTELEKMQKCYDFATHKIL
ncbi:MAG: site-specific integrase [Lawsonibacter sp.]|nr:site-specific integrase [Lawsonibacter sp.]